MTAISLAEATANDDDAPVLSPSCPAPAMPLDRFVAAVHAAKPGAEIEYFRGDLPNARHTGRMGRLVNLSPEDRAEMMIRSEIGIVANAAWDLYERGMVLLAQRRHGPMDYAYLAIKRRAPG